MVLIRRPKASLCLYLSVLNKLLSIILLLENCSGKVSYIKLTKRQCLVHRTPHLYSTNPIQ